MFPDFIDYINDPDAEIAKDGASLRFKGQTIEIRGDVPRFTPDMSYSDGNFARLRQEHTTLQLDSRNGSNERERTILERTTWPPEFFKGKTILECGCGAGPDTEILKKFGARVIAVDISGIDVAVENLGNPDDLSFVQASIMNLPFKPQSFDIVWCHRVIQHTPDPKATLEHILQFVKPDGAIFVHSYARTWVQMLRWKYALRPITKRLNSEKLYNFVKWYAPAAFKFTNFMTKIPGGKYFNFFFIPFLNYRHAERFDAFSDEAMLEYGIHDTFDALSPAYDIPLSAKFMRETAEKFITTPLEVAEHHTVTLMRTKPDTKIKKKKAA